MERTYEAPSNEAPHLILGYHQGRLVTYLQNQFFRINGIRLSQEPASRFDFHFMSALLSQSGLLSCQRENDLDQINTMHLART